MKQESLGHGRQTLSCNLFFLNLLALFVHQSRPGTMDILVEGNNK
jgi:hypothetical protein